MAPGRPPLCSPSEGQTLGLGARSQGLSTGAHPGGGLGAAGGFHPGEELRRGQEETAGSGPDPPVLGAESATALSPVQP